VAVADDALLIGELGRLRIRRDRLEWRRRVGPEVVDRLSEPEQGERDGFLAFLKSANVGTGKGDNDRLIIAEAMLSNPGSVPTFMTSDIQVLWPLYSVFSENPIEPTRNTGSKQEILAPLKDGFQIQIDGHVMKVVPIIDMETERKPRNNTKRGGQKTKEWNQKGPPIGRPRTRR
jgi:hypothetical protein